MQVRQRKRERGLSLKGLKEQMEAASVAEELDDLKLNLLAAELELAREREDRK